MNASSLSPFLPFTHFYFIPHQTWIQNLSLFSNTEFQVASVSIKGDIPFSWCVCHWALKLIQGKSFETFDGNCRRA